MDAQDKDGQQLRTKEAISLPVCLPGKWLLKQCACVCIPVHLIAWWNPSPKCRAGHQTLWHGFLANRNGILHQIIPTEMNFWGCSLLYRSSELLSINTKMKDNSNSNRSYIVSSNNTAAAVTSLYCFVCTHIRCLTSRTVTLCGRGISVWVMMISSTMTFVKLCSELSLHSLRGRCCMCI